MNKTYTILFNGEVNCYTSDPADVREALQTEGFSVKEPWIDEFNFID